MTDPEMLPWLRKAITERLELAREASTFADGHWWRRMADAGHFDDRRLEPVGPLWAGEPVLDADGDVYGGEEVVVYDEGRPSDAQFEHIAANDPQDAIARCEAELAILDRCDKAVRIARTYKDDAMVLALAEAKTWLDAAALVAAGYRHRPGWKAEWDGVTLPVPMGSKGPDERACRIEAANLVNKILRHLGAITALVPRGPLRDKADDEVEHIAELAEMIHDWKPDERA